MFEFKKSFRFAAEVKVQVPTEEGQKEKSFTGLFQFVPKAELDKLVGEMPGKEDTAVAQATFVGWKDDLTSNGEPLPFSEEARAELIASPFVRYAIAAAYWTEITGVRLKN